MEKRSNGKRRDGVLAKKSLGQNFLHDQSVLGRIADLSVPAWATGVVEIGPGTGNLTEHVLERLPADQVLTTVERDRRMAPLLAERLGARVRVIEADAADVDWPALLAPCGEKPVVVGNLPYYAALPILFAVLDARPARMVFMVQKEVADRLAAKPSTPENGQISIKIQMVADVQLAFKVGRGAFTPAPSVESAIVVLTPLAQPRFPIADMPWFTKLVTAGFGLRRKTLANALLAGLHLPGDDVRTALVAMGVDERIRAEALTLAQWARLTDLLPKPLPVNA